MEANKKEAEKARVQDSSSEKVAKGNDSGRYAFWG